jgi:hypothetical protein
LVLLLLLLLGIGVDGSGVMVVCGCDGISVVRPPRIEIKNIFRIYS